jgi:hypothetical protein
VKEETLRQALADADAAVWAGVVMPERLPAIATRLLVQGADSPALRELAGLDLAPFDPRDALDLLGSLLDESGVTIEPIADRTRRAAQVLAAAMLANLVSTPDSLHLFQRMAVAADYPNDPEIMALYGLDNEWSGGWGRQHEEIETEVRSEAARIVERGGSPTEIVVSCVRFT